MKIKLEQVLQAVDVAVEVTLQSPYRTTQMSMSETKALKIIQSYTGVVINMVWGIDNAEGTDLRKP